MTTIHVRATVRPDGSVLIPVGLDVAGCEVEVTVSSSSHLPRVEVSAEEYRRVLKETAGSITDPAFVRPDLGYIDAIPPLDVDE
jgi:hypothetical protein